MTFRTAQVGRGRIVFPFAGNTQGQLVSVSTNGAFAEPYTYDAWGNFLSPSNVDSASTRQHHERKH